MKLKGPPVLPRLERSNKNIEIAPYQSFIHDGSASFSIEFLCTLNCSKFVCKLPNCFTPSENGFADRFQPCFKQKNEVCICVLLETAILGIKMKLDSRIVY